MNHSGLPNLRKMVDDLRDVRISVFSRKSMEDAKEQLFELMYALVDRIEALENWADSEVAASKGPIVPIT